MKKNNYTFVLILAFPALISAQPLTWQGNDFSLRAKNMPLSSVFEEIAANYDTPINISPDISVIFNGTINPAPPLTILNNLVSRYNLAWYFDGSTLYIDPIKKLQSQVITLKTLPIANFTRYIHTQHITTNNKNNIGSSCEIKVIPQLNALEVRGVPSCLNHITQLASMLDGEMTKRVDNAVSVHVYPLKYASAMDSQYQYRDQTVVVPGLVSVLRDMNRGTITTSASGAPSEQVGLPAFSADPRQNAVVVRDHQANMSIYSKLLDELDQPPQMIEISVTIIDVDAGDISQLGIDWSASASLGNGHISFNDGKLSADSSGFSSVISDTPNFMIRLNALEKNSRARILSHPSVVTLNNIQAVLDKNVTFYTKLQSEKNAKLESITSGSLLRVTPRLLSAKGQQNIMLSLNIQDGQQSPALSPEEPLPEVQNSEISSQATLQAGQSLLLGGFIQDRQSQTQNKIPLLGDLPFLGHLFRSDVHQTQSVVRLFLIEASVAHNVQS